jgi:hypothetical protein
MTTLGPEIELRLSIQRALLGAITCNIHSVTCGIRRNEIQIVAYFRGDVSPEDVERFQVVSTEVIADFPEPYTIREACVSLSEQCEQMLDFWAFRKAPEDDD